MTAPMEAARDPARAILWTVEPQLFVTDMARALAFYTEKMGFSSAFVHGEPPFYAQVVRDGAKLNLRHVDRSAEPDLLSASMTVDHAGRLFEELQERRVTFHQTLARESWHGPDRGAFIVADPDGNLLLFVGGVDEQLPAEG